MAQSAPVPFLVTLVATGSHPKDLDFFRSLNVAGISIDNGWRNLAGSLGDRGHMYDGITLLIQAGSLDQASTFRDRIQEDGGKLGFDWSRIHVIPLIPF